MGRFMTKRGFTIKLYVAGRCNVQENLLQFKLI